MTAYTVEQLYGNNYLCLWTCSRNVVYELVSESFFKKCLNLYTTKEGEPRSGWPMCQSVMTCDSLGSRLSVLFLNRRHIHCSYTQVPASAGKAEAGMVHSVSGWTQCVQVKLWDPLRTCAIPEHLRDLCVHAKALYKSMFTFNFTLQVEVDGN